MLVDFLAQEISVTLDGRSYPVIVAADVLEAWWGGDRGPQTAQALINANRAAIEAVVARKLNGRARPAKGPIRVEEDDLD